MSYNRPTTCPEFFDAIHHRRPFDTSVRNARERVRVEGHYIAVLSHHLHSFDLRGELADDVVRSAKDLYERYVEEQPAIAHFPMTRDAHPPRYDASGQVEQEPNPDGGKPDRRALYTDEAVYYVSATTESGMTTVLGLLTAGGEARINSQLSSMVQASRADAIRLGLREAAKLVQDRTATYPYYFDGAIVARNA